MAKYAAAYADPQGPDDGRPTAQQLLADQGLSAGHLRGCAALVTGASGGIGAEVASVLHSLGADVFITARDSSKGQAVAARIRQEPGPGRVELLHLELASLHSVRDCAAAFLRTRQDLAILVCNAGVMCCPQRKTEDGFEMHWQTNFLSHFLLANLLQPALQVGSTPQLHSRVVSVASTGHRWQTVLLDDYNLEKKGYDPGCAYGQSKTAQIWMSNEDWPDVRASATEQTAQIERRWGPHGVHGLSCHPGVVVSDLGRHLDEEQWEWWRQPHVQAQFCSPAQGAATPVYAAVGRDLEGRGGLYLEARSLECRTGRPVEPDTPIYGPGFAPHAFDNDAQRKLWDLSLQLTGLVP